MIKTLADRLAEALAELMHQRVRKEWGFPDDGKITNEWSQLKVSYSKNSPSQVYLN